MLDTVVGVGPLARRITRKSTGERSHDRDRRRHTGLRKKCKTAGLTNIWLGFAAFAAAILMGLYQMAARSNLFPAAGSRGIYDPSAPTHGVLMTYALAKVFIMGSGDSLPCIPSSRMSGRRCFLDRHSFRPKRKPGPMRSFPWAEA